MPVEVSASRYSSPALALEMTSRGESGITAQAANAGTRARIGATRNRNLLALDGTITSVASSLNTSANGCPSPGKRPKIRTRFGPRRSCIQQMTFLSHRVRYETQRLGAPVTVTIHDVVRT